MKALKLSSSPDEKKQLKAQCGEIMNSHRVPEMSEPVNGLRRSL
jgi:hypothetical protein